MNRLPDERRREIDEWIDAMLEKWGPTLAMAALFAVLIAFVYWLM